MGDGDLRMLGAVDGYSHALIRVRQEIDRLDGRYAPGIHPRHTRKISARDAKLRPLRDLERWLENRRAETHAAYDATRNEK